MNNIEIIAEIGQAHDGSLGILHSYIEALSKTGVDTAKFQIHIAEAESSIYEPFRIDFSYADKTRYDYWKRMEFSFEEWKSIKKHCEKVGLEFLATPFSIAAVDLLEDLEVKKYKVGSGDVKNLILLEKIARTGKDTIISTGMSNFEELDVAFKMLNNRGIKVSILQCTTIYPTQPNEIGLNIIDELSKRYNVPIGLSDHSGTIFPSIAATALGAEIIEFHITFDRDIFGPDSKASLTINEVKYLVEGIRYIEKVLKNPLNKNQKYIPLDLESIFGRTLAVNKELTKGHILTFDDLESKKPAGKGIPVNQFKYIIGKKLKDDLRKYQFLQFENLYE